MTDNELILSIKEAIELLHARDYWLLKNDLSEQSISHKLAEHLQRLIPDYHVDCEYDGDIDNINWKQKIAFLKGRLETKLLSENQVHLLDHEPIERAVFPDIIIHHRGTNTGNKCIMEIRKSTNQTSFDYDRIKLESYTSAINGKNLGYQLGVFINFQTGQDVLTETIIYFKNGEEYPLAKKPDV